MRDVAAVRHLGSGVAQITTARQAHTQPRDALRVRLDVERDQIPHAETRAQIVDRLARSRLYIIPQAARARVRPTPRRDDLLDGLITHRVKDRPTHLPIGTDAALIPSSEFGHLALELALALRDVARIFVEDASGCHLVQVVPVAAIIGLEGGNLPVLARQPCQHAPFDVRQVGDDQLLTHRRDQRAAHAEGATLANVVPDDVFAVRLEGSHGRLLHDVVEPVRRAGQVLRLEQPTGIAPGARRAAELDQAAQATVTRRAVQKHSVLGGAGRCGLLADLQQLTHLRIEIPTEQIAEGGARQIFRLEVEPVLEMVKQALALRGRRDAASGQMGCTRGQSS